MNFLTIIPPGVLAFGAFVKIDGVEVLGDEQVFSFDGGVKKIQGKEVFSEEFLIASH